MPIILALIEFSLAGFLGCMTGPKPPQELPTRPVLVRWDSHYDGGSVEVRVWAVKDWQVSIRVIEDDLRYRLADGYLRRLPAECVEGGYDVDRDDDVDLRDWSVLVRQIAWCGSNRCFRAAN